jgi:hypothetical protein
MKKVAVISLIIIALLSTLIYYQTPIRLWAYEWGHAIIGGLSSGTGVPLKVDADGAVYVDMSGMTLLYTGANRGGVSTIVSTVSTLNSTNLAFAILKLSGASKTFSIAEGANDGQEITLVKDEYDARTLTLSLTPDLDITHTGFTSITWDSEAGSYVSLTWVDSTVGWIITGSKGVTITY